MIDITKLNFVKDEHEQLGQLIYPMTNHAYAYI